MAKKKCHVTLDWKKINETRNYHVEEIKQSDEWKA